MHSKYCKIVYDGVDLTVPEEMGKAKDNQLKGNDRDNLTELCGRVCYDSLGTGRSSEEYHKHIVEVGHGSVQEHANITFVCKNLSLNDCLSLREALANRPGVWSIREASGTSLFNLRITTNLRTLREWRRFPMRENKFSDALGAKLRLLAKPLAPLVLFDVNDEETEKLDIEVGSPKHDEEIWISFFMTNVSRGLTHELVRHGDWTAISQRSTRYVEECESPWVWHPLINRWLEDDNKDLPIAKDLQTCIELCQKTYGTLRKYLEYYLEDTLRMDKFTARKQARGAARGVLGNALMTELIFSANLAQWKRMIWMRASNHADAEIRLLFNDIFDILKERYPNRFEGWRKTTAKDNMGFDVGE